MLSNAEINFLVAGFGMLGMGIVGLISEGLVRRGHPTVTKWFGSSSTPYVHMGIFGTVYGLLNFVRFVLPDRFFGIIRPILSCYHHPALNYSVRG